MKDSISWKFKFAGDFIGKCIRVTSQCSLILFFLIIYTLSVFPTHAMNPTKSCRTNVMNSISPISLNDLEGIPPLPLEIDDDYLTTSTSTPQPRGSISYMTGFVAVSRIFHILGQCQIRQKTWTQNPSAGPKRGDLLEWIEESQREMREILEALPGGLGADARGGGGGGGGSGSGGTGEMRGTGAGTGGGAGKGGFERADESSLGIQRANIHITALCVDFALVSGPVRILFGVCDGINWGGLNARRVSQTAEQKQMAEQRKGKWGRAMKGKRGEAYARG